MRGAARCVTRSAAQYREVYPGSKLNHFRKISQASAVGCGSMLFFDDEPESNMVGEWVGPGTAGW